MTILLSALAVAFAAVCVWLAVRIVNRRERWAKWTAVALLAALLYGLSYGPANGIANRLWFPAEAPLALRLLYWPMVQLDEHGPQQIRRGINWYVRLWL
jgi:hypothetical protein